MASSGVGCNVGAGVAGAVHLLAGFILMTLQPFRMPADKYLVPLTTFIVGLVCVLKSTDNANLTSASDGMTATAAVLQVVRTVLCGSPRVRASGTRILLFSQKDSPMLLAVAAKEPARRRICKVVIKETVS
ncbi:transmembrane protein, putative [Bodo saltans]|uniref:Transmembrane protein, putative n=1 Tax=Bodo saltans TaxID=75058 RepID=A0A0S4ILR6_BODSA|nr:transmembrane protein, putative [Bodo saltans]|eukprot:CUF31010.1 transmembrane protein, putative [Bodo saltans]